MLIQCSFHFNQHSVENIRGPKVKPGKTDFVHKYYWPGTSHWVEKLGDMYLVWLCFFCSIVDIFDPQLSWMSGDQKIRNGLARNVFSNFKVLRGVTSALQLKTTRNIPVVNRAGFITCCTKAMALLVEAHCVSERPAEGACYQQEFALG